MEKGATGSHKYPLLTKLRKDLWDEALEKQPRLQEAITRIETRLAKVRGGAVGKEFYWGYEALLYAAATLEDINATFGKGETLLHWTTISDDLCSTSASVLFLLILGANPNAQDDLGRTPLHWAITHDNIDSKDKENTMQYLICFKASVNITDIYGATPLCHAVWLNEKKAVRILESLTDASLNKTPEFMSAKTEFPWTANEDAKTVRRSKIQNWIDEEASDTGKNRDRLNNLLTVPGVGLLHHAEEVAEQCQQVLALLQRISDIMSEDDPLMSFMPRLAGSNAEGTKCGLPDEQDVIINLVNFQKISFPVVEERFSEGFIALKVKDNCDETYLTMENYILDGYLNSAAILNSFVTKFLKTLSMTRVWKYDKANNLYPERHMLEELTVTVKLGDIGLIIAVWHGRYYKHVKVTIDIVPAISLGGWRPLDAVLKNPLGRVIESELFVILRSESKNDAADFEELFDSEDISAALNEKTYRMNSHFDDIFWSDTDNQSVSDLAKFGHSDDSDMAGQWSSCDSDAVTPDEISGNSEQHGSVVNEDDGRQFGSGRCEELGAPHIEEEGQDEEAVAQSTNGVTCTKLVDDDDKSDTTNDHTATGQDTSEMYFEQDDSESHAGVISEQQDEKGSHDLTQSMAEDMKIFRNEYRFSMSESSSSAEEMAEDDGDMNFRISYCQAEIDTIRSLPENVRRAYVLSKCLAEFVPAIRHTRDEVEHVAGNYGGVKDIFSYLIKTSLFQAYYKYQCASSSRDLTDPDTQRSSRSPYHDKRATACDGMDSALPPTDSSFTAGKPVISYEDLTEIAAWVDLIFAEMEHATQAGQLPAFFQPKNNVLSKVIFMGDVKKWIHFEGQRDFPYPALEYLTVHCKMIRALVRV